MQKLPGRGVTPLLVLLTLGAVFVALSSCSARQDIAIKADGSGSANLSVTVHPILVSYFNDLMIAMTGVEREYPIFDLEHIRESFSERPGTELLLLEEVERGSLRLEVAFADVNTLLTPNPASAVATPIISFVSRPEERELRLRLDRAALDEIMNLAPPGTSVVSGYLFPPIDGSVSRDEFRSEMAWALEEYADRRTVERVLDEAAIDVVVTTAGRILRQTGGSTEGGVTSNTVRWSIPVLDLITLSDERVYSVVFSP